MVQYFGDFAEDDTVDIPFNTFTSDDPAASSTITNLADADIKVHKDGGLTQATTDGATVIINFDGITGNHLITVDTSVDAFYVTGSEYQVRIEGTTVDGGTINAWVGCFSIERAGGVLALIKAGNLSANVVQISGDSTAADNAEAFFDGTGYAGTNNVIPVVTLVNTTTTLTNGATLAAGAITNASLAGNMEIVFETDFATNYNTTRNAWATNTQDLVGTGAWNVGKTGYSLTATTGLGAQTANITGNLSGSVGSVTAGVTLAADAITSAKIADNAFLAVNFGADFLTSAKIADNAFLAVNFAASSLNGKGDWNIGKTGYALTTADWNVGKTGYSLSTTPASATDMAKVPKSDGTVSWNATALGAINAEADTAISDAALATAANLATVDGIVDNLLLGIIFGTAATGTLSTTQATSNLSGFTDDQLIGRVIIFTSGPADGEATDITDYEDTNGLLTFTALTLAPENGNAFKIV